MVSGHVPGTWFGHTNNAPTCLVTHTHCRYPHHQQVVEEEDLPLVNTAPLRPVGVRYLIQLAAAHQPTVGQRQYLQAPHGGRG